MRSLTPQARPFALGAMAAVLVACAGAPPTPATPATVAAPAVAPPAPVEAKPDLSPVAEPADVIALVRWKSPDASLASIAAWTGMPVTASDLAQELSSKLGAVAATNVPVDLVVALDPRAARPLVAFSIGLRSLDDAIRAASGEGKVESVGPGIARVRVARGAKGRPRGVCLVSAAAGDAPARLVCGERDVDVDGLAPWLTRTLSRVAPPAADVHAEARFAPLRARFGAKVEQSLRLGAALGPSQIQIGDRTFDHAATDAAQAVAGELGAVFNELDTLTADVTLGADGGEADVALRLAPGTSWTAARIASLASRASLPPGVFSRLPADAAQASFGSPSDPQETAPIRVTLAALLDGWLAHDGVATADRRALVALLDAKWMGSAATAYAHGSVASELARADDADPVHATLDHLGWHVVGFEEPAERVTGWLRALAGALGRPAVTKRLARALEDLGAAPGALPVVRLVGAPAGLPRGSVELDVVVDLATWHAADDADFDASGKRKPKKAAKKARDLRTLHLLSVPDGGRGWLALGLDRPSLVEHLKVALAGAREATLASRPGLDALRAQPLAGGGFFTVAGLLGSAGGALHQALGRPLSSVLDAMPHHGETPLVYTVRAAGGSGAELGAHLWWPRAVLDDVMAAGMQAAGAHGATTKAPGKK